ncbi:hypothetical protein PC118_g16682 [Phytophthora cactorum]|uniref:Uncharacterized protein n=1 Tax=Phytophthora cactorum TaxID=29920 RepID=A0A8T1FLS9_9STRA|nr:hypothetical protein PC112_g16807 [Phytophthora cactorum]KAG2970754.1 hypothetical protein PC118_g16682 [Phytophthora cactorum]
MVEGLSTKRAMVRSSTTQQHEAESALSRARSVLMRGVVARAQKHTSKPRLTRIDPTKAVLRCIMSLKAPLTSHEREKSELNWRGKYTCSISLFVELRTANLCPSYTPLQSFQEIFFGNVRYFPCGGSIINNSKLQTKA